MHRLRCAVSIGLIFVLGVSASGCHSTRRASVPATEPPSPYFDGEVYGVTTSAGDQVTFDEPGELVIRGVAGGDPARHSTRDAEFTVVRGTVDGSPREFQLTEVQRVWLEQRKLRVWVAIGVAAAVVAVWVGILALSYRG